MFRVWSIVLLRFRYTAPQCACGLRLPSRACRECSYFSSGDSAALEYSLFPAVFLLGLQSTALVPATTRRSASSHTTTRADEWGLQSCELRLHNTRRWPTAKSCCILVSFTSVPFNCAALASASTVPPRSSRRPWRQSPHRWQSLRSRRHVRPGLSSLPPAATSWKRASARSRRSG